MQPEQPDQPAEETDDTQHDQQDEQHDSSTLHEPLLDDTDSSLPAYYLNLSDFTSQLSHPEPAVIESALARFVAQVKGEHIEYKANPAALPTDPPSPLLAAYIAASPQAHELFAVLGRPSSSYTLSAKLLDALHLILSTRYHMPSTALLPVLSALGRRFLRSHVRLLYRLMGLQDTRLPAVALRLLTTLCTLSHDLLRDTVHALDLHNKALLSIAARVQAARAGKGGEEKVGGGSEGREKRVQQLQRLRTAYLSLFLQLIRSSDPDVLATLLASPPYIASVVKGLKGDESETVRSVLEALVGVLEARGVGDELRYTALFSSHTLDTLTRLYVDDEREGGRLAGVLYGFFVSLLRVVRSGHAWSVEHREFSRWKYHKQLLTRLLSSLHPTASSQQQQLSLSVLSSFPSLLPSYIAHLGVAFEPRLSTRYVANVALLCRLLAVPLSASHLHFLASECQSAGQFSQLALSHLLPTALTKLLLSQSVQHANPLVQLTALTLLTSLLHRYSHLLTLLTSTLTANPAYRSDVCAELRKRLPDIQVVFGLRAKIFPSTSMADGGVESERRVELYSRVLEVLGLYQRLLVVGEAAGGGSGGNSSGKVDMWKLLLTPAPFTWRTTQQLLTLLTASNNSPRLFHLPQRLVRDDSKQAEEQVEEEDEVKPTSYFGHLLSILLQCRQQSASSPDAAAIVHRQTMELITTALSRTGGYSPASPSHRVELVAFLSQLTPAVLPFLEHAIALTQSKPSATTVLPPFPLLHASLYGRGWVGTEREYERASGYVCAVLGQLLTVMNEQRVEVAAAAVRLAGAKDADEGKVADDASEEKVATAARNGVVQRLKVDPRFHAVLKHAASLLPESTLPKLQSASRQHPFSRLSRLSGEQWLAELPALIRDSLTSGWSRHSLILHLSLNSERPLLASQWVQSQLTADVQNDESAAVKALVLSLPPSILFRPTQLPECGPAVSLVCERWARDGHSAAEQLVLLTELSSVVVDALTAVTAGSISSSSITVPLSALLTLVHTLVLSAPGSVVSRLSAAFTVERDGKRLADYFLCPLDAMPAPLTSTVTLALTSLIQSALSVCATPDLQPLCEPFFLRLVDSCTNLVRSPPSSTVPLPLLVLDSLSSHLTAAQLTSLSTKLLSSPAAGGWLRVLSRQSGLARQLLSHNPARAFAVIAEQLAIGGAETSDSEQQALDELALDLLQPTHTETASASLRAALVPEQLFTAALLRPSTTRLRLIAALLRSTASVIHAQPFATHVSQQLSTSSSAAELVPFLPSFAAYVRAIAALPPSLLPDSHSAVVALLTQLVQSLYLPAIRRVSVEQAVVQQVDQLVKSMVDADTLTLDDRQAMLTLLLAPPTDSTDNSERKQQSNGDEAESQPTGKKSRKDRDVISRPILAVTCHLLSFFSPSTAKVGALLPHASLLLIRLLSTLVTHFKVEASVGDDVTVEYEEALLSAAISLLGGRHSLATVDSPAEAGLIVAAEMTKRPRVDTLSSYSPHLSLASLVAVSSPSAVSKLLTRFVTSALRSRFDLPDTHRLLFLLLQLQLQPDDRSKVSVVLSLTPSSLLAAPTASRIELDVLNGAGVEMLSAHTVFDLLVSHSHFVPTLLPALSASVAVSSTTTSASSLPLRLSLLHLLYLLFHFPVSPAPIPAPSSLLSVLTSVYTGTHSVLDVTLLTLLSLLASSSSAVLSSRTRWGEVGQQQLRALIASGENGSTANRLDDDGVWLYTAFSSPQLQRGPLLSSALLHIPPSLTTLSVFAPHDSKRKQQRDDAHPSAAAGVVGVDVLLSHYSPHFVLPFFLHLFRHTQPDIRRLIELGVLAYTLLSLSHPRLAVRKAAYKLIAKFYSEMERTQADEDKLQAERAAQRSQQQDGQPATAHTVTPSGYHDPKRQRTLAHVTFKEQPELLFLLTTLRNAITTPHMHLSCVLTSFLAAASVVLLHPSHSLYRPINRFLTLSPSLPLRTVPLFHDLLMSRRADEWRRDRAWLLRWLDEAAAGGGVKEWHILRRRRVLSTLMTFHDSRQADRYTRTLVLDFIKRVALMGRDSADCVEGEEAEWEAGEGVALAGLVRNHGLLVWLRQMVAGQGLGLATLVPAMELALLVVREVRRRLPDEAPRIEEVEELEVKEVEHTEMEDIADSESEDEPVNDVDDSPAVGIPQARRDDAAAPESEDAEGEDNDDEDEDEQVEEHDQDDTAAGRLKAARALSRRRLGLAQDMQLLASSLVQRLTQTLQQSGETAQPPAAVDGEAAESGTKTEDDKETGQLGFGSPSASSLSASLPTISLCLSLLHALAVTARKARKASGIDQSTSSFTALLLSAGCLEVSFAPSEAALLCSSAAQLSESSSTDIFHSITLSALTLPLLSADLESEKRALVSVVEWTHGRVLAASNEHTVLVAQWLEWLTAQLTGHQLLREWLLASEHLLVRALLSFYPLLMQPPSPNSSPVGLAQLNRTLLQLDSLLPADDQVTHHLQASSHHSTLRSSYQQLRTRYDEHSSNVPASDWGAEVRAAVLLRDVWLVRLAGDVEAQEGVTLHSVTLQQREQRKQNGNSTPRVNGLRNKRK